MYVCTIIFRQKLGRSLYIVFVVIRKKINVRKGGCFGNSSIIASPPPQFLRFWERHKLWKATPEISTEMHNTYIRERRTRERPTHPFSPLRNMWNVSNIMYETKNSENVECKFRTSAPRGCRRKKIYTMKKTRSFRFGRNFAEKKIPRREKFTERKTCMTNSESSSKAT